MNFLSGVGKFDKNTLTASQKANLIKLGPSTASATSRTRNSSISSTGSRGSTESTKSMSALSEVSDDYDEDNDGKTLYDFVPFLQVRAEHFLDDYAKHSHGIMSRKVLDNFKKNGNFENPAVNKVARDLIIEMKNSSNLRGTDSEKEKKIRDELIKLIKERYNTNLNKKHRITKIHVERLGGKRKTRKSKKSKRASRKH